MAPGTVEVIDQTLVVAGMEATADLILETVMKGGTVGAMMDGTVEVTMEAGTTTMIGVATTTTDQTPTAIMEVGTVVIMTEIAGMVATITTTGTQATTMEDGVTT